MKLTTTFIKYRSHNLQYERQHNPKLSNSKCFQELIYENAITQLTLTVLKLFSLELQRYDHLFFDN